MHIPMAPVALLALCVAQASGFVGCPGRVQTRVARVSSCGPARARAVFDWAGSQSLCMATEDGDAEAEYAEARIVVGGQATGGYFRAHARNEAFFNRKLCGALKEMDGGKTEIIVEGKKSAIDSFARWCKRGPGLTQKIEDVELTWGPWTGIFDGFDVYPLEGGSDASAGSQNLRMATEGGDAEAEYAEARIVVGGQATGGYFRAHARNEAFFNRKLCGALKELEGGKTEIIVEGKKSAINSFARWCKRGPGLTQKIEDVELTWGPWTGIFDGFEVFPLGRGSDAGAGRP